MEIEIVSKDNTNDFVQLIKVFEKVFEMQDVVLPDDQYLLSLLQKDNFLAVVAKENQKIVGGLTVYILEQYFTVRPLAYVFDLAVLHKYQRKGIGKKLMGFVTNYCRENGFEEVFVQADRVDGYVVDFYRKTLPTQEEDVLHFYYTL